MKRKYAAMLCLLCSLVLLPTVLQAQQNDQDLANEIKALKTGQQEIQKELTEIKKLLQARPAAPAKKQGAQVKDVVFDLADNPVKGASTAKLTLVEFSDYQ